jgi:hypothetical protein
MVCGLMSVYFLVSKWVALQALYCVVWKDNCSNMSAVSYELVKCELCLY